MNKMKAIKKQKSVLPKKKKAAKSDSATINELYNLIQKLIVTNENTSSVLNKLRAELYGPKVIQLYNYPLTNISK